MKNEERKRSTARMMQLIIPCMVVIFALSGVFQEVHAWIATPVTGYRDVKEQFKIMCDNINASDGYVIKDESLHDDIYMYPEDAMIFINDLCTSNGLEIKKLRFNQETYLSAEIKFVCTYACLLSFVDDVKIKGFNSVVSSVNAFDLGDGSIDVVVVLKFYGLEEGGHISFSE